MNPTVSASDIDRICSGDHHDPFAVLGCHPVTADGREMVAIRALLPHAKRAYVIRDRYPQRRRLKRVDDRGLFEVVFPRLKRVFGYRVEVHCLDGSSYTWEDPYRFGPVLTDFDLQLLGEGSHLRRWEVLGAHEIEHGGVRGTQFAVWAPNARRVSVIGDFNGWDGRQHAMRNRGGSGVWEIFLPGVGPGTLYKYEVRGPDGAVRTKSDPHALHAEVRPGTASVVWDIDRYAWGDSAWMQRRASTDPLTTPMSVYEVHLGSWRRNALEGYRWLTYRELADELTEYVVEMGYTHVELLPVSEHPHDASWGYQCLGYYAPTSRFGTPEDFMFLVDSLHRAGIGVLLDWVPAHFPRDDQGLARFDGTACYEHPDPRLGEHPDWGTLIFDYGRAEVRNFLVASALFWLDRYHIDGLRVDAVASMIYLDYSREDGQWQPNEQGGNHNLQAVELLQQLNTECHDRHPGAVVIAEESTAYDGVTRPVGEGGLGFTFKWNMGWMNDTLDYIARDPIHRCFHHNQLTFGMMYAYSENFVLPISHDEVVHMKGSLHGKMPGDEWQKLANLRLYLGLQWTMPGKPLLFMGQDMGQPGEWSEDESLPWHLLQHEPHARINAFVRALNHVYRDAPPLWQRDHSWEGFQWLDADDADGSTLAYLRRGADPSDHRVVVCNFTPVVRKDYRLGVPEAGWYEEALNSDAEAFDGSGVSSPVPYAAETAPAMDQPASIRLDLPPLAILILRPMR
jgi:1,4-alpha-glucan branching enzyme